MSGIPHDLVDFMTDPVEYFDWSFTRLLTMSKEDQATYQLAGLKHRFNELRDRIPYLKKLADREGIDEITSLEDIVPLLLEHTVYKSYPASLIEKSNFRAINTWLGKLTTVDLSQIDVSHCDSIDSWIDTMDTQSDLVIHHSSGTSGTVSLFPKSRKEFDAFSKHWPLRFQKFGEPRPDDIQPQAHVISPTYRSGGSAHFRILDKYFERVAHGDPAFMHTAFEGRMSADILYLAGRMRAAKARGDLDRLEIPPNLLARLDEFETGASERAGRMGEFLNDITSKLAGKRVFMGSAPTYLLPMAKNGLAEGKSAVFASDSVIGTGGGAKGIVLPDDWKETVLAFTGGKRLSINYGMTELQTPNMMCENGNYHAAPTLIPFILDPNTSRPLPRTGTVTGRMAFFDLVPDTHWGGFISGDEVTITWDAPCGCGRTGHYFAPTIGRYSDQQGGDDKISCAASAEAHEEAMEFLSEMHMETAA